MTHIPNLYWEAAQKLSRQKLVVVCLGIIAIYILVALLGGFNVLPDYQTRVGQNMKPLHLNSPNCWAPICLVAPFSIKFWLELKRQC